MSGGVTAYGCTGPEGFASACGAGVPLRDVCGFRLGRTLARALAQRGDGEYGGGWPLRVFRVWVEAEDVLAADDLEVRACTFRIERELPLEEALGPRVRDIAGLVDRLGRIRWLRPGSTASAGARIDDLVAEHHVALADYGAVRPPPVRRLATWHEARDAQETARAIIPPVVAAVAWTSRGIDGASAQCATRIARQAGTRLAYFGAWDAAWRAAEASVATRLQPFPFGVHARDVESADRTIAAATRAVEALTAARAPARRAAWEVALQVLTDAPGTIPAPEVVYRDAVAAAQNACAGCSSPGREMPVSWLITLTGVMAWRLAMTAAFHAAWRLSYLVNDIKRPDPWRPLVDLWDLGAWPIGMAKGSYAVYLPQSTPT
jgi:hypothetical protein